MAAETWGDIMDSNLLAEYNALVKFSMLDMDNLAKYRYMVVTQDEYREHVLNLYFEKHPRRRKVPSDGILIGEHPDLIILTDEHFVGVTETRVRDGIEAFRKVEGEVLANPIPTANTTDDWQLIVSKSSTHYRSQGMAAVKYAKASLISRLHMLTACNIEAELRTVDHGKVPYAELYAKCTELEALTIRLNFVPTLEGIITEYATLWEMGTNPMVLTYGLDKDLIYFVQKNRHLSISDIIDLWRGNE